MTLVFESPFLSFIIKGLIIVLGVLLINIFLVMSFSSPSPSLIITEGNLIGLKTSIDKIGSKTVEAKGN